MSGGSFSERASTGASNMLDSAKRLLGVEPQPRTWVDELESKCCGWCPSFTWQQRLFGCLLCFLIGACVCVRCVWMSDGWSWWWQTLPTHHPRTGRQSIDRPSLNPLDNPRTPPIPPSKRTGLILEFGSFLRSVRILNERRADEPLSPSGVTCLTSHPCSLPRLDSQSS